MSLDIGRPLLYKLVFEGLSLMLADVGSKLQIQYRPQLQTAVRILKFVILIILIMQLQTAI